MTITRVREGSATDTVANVTVTLAAAPANGDLLVALVSGPVTTVSSGWAKLTNITSTGNGALFWKVAGAGESATQQPCTTTALWVCVMREYNSSTGWAGSPA